MMEGLGVVVILSALLRAPPFFPFDLKTDVPPAADLDPRSLASLSLSESAAGGTSV
eukprot:CAMPEP_0198467018 /NCGR_PEP_ID=MMETSP1456-20131121/4389_1 /TAXON_ID=1461544 ORGANISM="Unidentified sp., Strain RCC1871" /NCGR_SAMPLE_ID=MMETSP1456 /ASSEMBLY_ACC=CAM_ASM_001119 /LENGTH=55 /DNA_ID=CAMNT_0044193001 /DNA_START=107 /DNA_END=270 /DNA_ORIENTATION=-